VAPHDAGCHQRPRPHLRAAQHDLAGDLMSVGDSLLNLIQTTTLLMICWDVWMLRRELNNR
jgi:hypothetical protein